MDKLPKQGVLNRSDILFEKNEELLDSEFNINNEYFIVVLLALVHVGYANLVLKNTTITASNMEQLINMGNMDIYEFKYMTKPKEAAIAELKRLLGILHLPGGMTVNNKELENGLKTMILPKISEVAEQSIKYKNYLNNEPTLWGEFLFPEHIKGVYELKISYVLNEFSNFNSRYNTVAKLNNLNLTMEQLDEIEEGIKYIDIIKEYEKFKLNTDSIVNYISNVENTIIPDSVAESIKEAKDKFFEIRDGIRDDLDGEKAGRELQGILMPIKQEYIDYYFDKHTKARLGTNDAKRKGKIMKSDTLSSLKKLTEIKGIFQENKLKNLEKELSSLQICYELTTADLQKNPVCSKCKFTLSNDLPTVEGKLEYIEDNLDKLLSEWTEALLSALDDPLTVANKSLLNKNQRKLIDEFLQKKQLPDKVDTFFTDTFNTLFEKLDKVEVDVWDLMSITQNLGPSTVNDLKNKLNYFIDKQVAGKDLKNVRIIITSKSEKRKDFLIAEASNAEEVTY